MLRRAIVALKDPKNRDIACVAGGMGALLAGRKVIGLGLFAKGFYGLERRWREERAFDGTWAERWERSVAFYEATHTHPVNRTLHRVGIPMIVAGAAGLLAYPAYRPLWAASAGLFTVGWGLNFVGHGLYEKNAPAFADDPLSFLAGPMWDLQQLRGDAARRGPSAVTVEHAPLDAPEPVAAGA